jgi:hypothetical protein
MVLVTFGAAKEILWDDSGIVKLLLKDLLITGMKVISTMLVDIAQMKLRQTSEGVC